MLQTIRWYLVKLLGLCIWSVVAQLVVRPDDWHYQIILIIQPSCTTLAKDLASQARIGVPVPGTNSIFLSSRIPKGILIDSCSHAKLVKRRWESYQKKIYIAGRCRAV